MYPDFHFNYKFDPQFWEIQCDTPTFEKTYAQIPSSPENSKMSLMFFGKITLMYPDFHFNYKFDTRFLEIMCNTLIFTTIKTVFHATLGVM